MAARRVRAGAGRADPDGRLAGRPDRAATRLPGRPGPLHGGLAGLRAGADRDAAQHRPGAAGRGRRGDAGHQPGTDRGRVRRAGAPRRACGLGRGQRHRDRRRPARRRRAGRGLRLALDLPRQRAAGDRDGVPDDPVRPPVAQPVGAPRRLARRCAVERRAGRARPRPVARQRRRLVEPADRGLLAACALGLLAFVAVERRVSSPILDLSLWRKPTTAGASIAVFTVAAAAFAMLSFLSLYLQNTLGHGPLGPASACCRSPPARSWPRRSRGTPAHASRHARCSRSDWACAERACC